MNQLTNAAAPARYQPDQIVVSLPHLDMVLKKLGGLSAASQNSTPVAIQAKVAARDGSLGLALVKFPDLPRDAAPLRSDSRLVADAIRARDRSGLSGPVPDLDLVMFKLRTEFAHSYRGWTPDLGKNRFIDGIHGFPEIVGGDEGNPVPNPEIVGGGKGLPSAPTSRAFQLPPRRRPTGEQVRVGVLDTKLYPLPQLDGRYIAEAGALVPKPSGNGRAPVWALTLGHATFIAGLILRYAPTAELTVRAVLDDRTATATAWQVAQKLIQFRGSGIDVLNLSFGCRVDDGQGPLLLRRAIDLLDRETVLVAAAGNVTGTPQEVKEARRRPVYPAAFQDVIAVGARDSQGVSRAPFSACGPWVDVYVPGVDIESLYLPGRVELPSRNGRPVVRTFPGSATWSGTSFAAAIVSGRIAARTRPGSRSARAAAEQILREAR
jgi:hypothetical protein